jgi:uncharacterized protein
MLSGGWVYVIALTASFVFALVASPAGVSGAVLLLPFQVSVLGTPSPSVTPTNLLYNVIATPGAIFQYWRQGQTGGRLTRLLLAGSIPGVIVGSVIRVEFLPSARDFDAVIATVLVPLGGWLLFRRSAERTSSSLQERISPRVLVLLSLIVGVIGGIYGIGGGSVLAPTLVASGRSPREVAPATLVATFVTSVGGIATFLILSIRHGSVAPDWGVGLAIGVGGFCGAFLGARTQPLLSESLIQRALGILIVAIGLRYAWIAA